MQVLPGLSGLLSPPLSASAISFPIGNLKMSRSQLSSWLSQPRYLSEASHCVRLLWSCTWHLPEHHCWAEPDCSWRTSAGPQRMEIWHRSWHLFISSFHEALIPRMTMPEGREAIKRSKESCCSRAKPAAEAPGVGRRPQPSHSAVLPFGGGVLGFNRVFLCSGAVR